MYSVQNSIAKINGASGIYDGKVHNSSVRYGRNSVNNMQGYLQDYTIAPPEDKFPNLEGISKLSNEEFDKKMTELEGQIETRLNKTDKWLDSLPPLDFEQRYMPKGKGVDKMALMGAAYEEMGKRTEMKTSELTSTMQEAFGKEVTADALDLNKDGKIDVAEYSTSILLSDAMGEDGKTLTFDNIDGTITNKGQNATLPYANKKNYEIANKTYQALFERYNLDGAQEEFLLNKNNMSEA